MTMLKIKPPEFLFPEVDLPSLDLPTEDGVPLETNWHRIQMNLLIDSVHFLWHDRTDYFAGGNMFIYFSFEQVRNRDYRGPDFFVVKGVDGTQDRGAWVVWEEEGRYPNVIVELSSPSTLEIDLGPKKVLYEKTFRTPEYFCYDPDGSHLVGWRLQSGHYVELEPDAAGRLWSEELGVWLGNWQGEFQRVTATWLRFYDEAGELSLTLAEAEAQRAEREAWRAKLEAHRAEKGARRAEEEARRAEAEIARLRALLDRHGIGADREQSNGYDT